jgi:hypothetical protein
MTTCARVNKALANEGLDIQLYWNNAGAYHYFAGPDAECMHVQGLYGWSVRLSNPEQIVAEAKRRIDESTK